MTPPKVLPAPKPVSSVMMRRMFGAPFGGTMRGGHHDFDWSAFRSIWPPNGRSGGGSCFPVGVTVADGDPGSPVICCAAAAPASMPIAVAARTIAVLLLARIEALLRVTAGWVVTRVADDHAVGAVTTR